MDYNYSVETIRDVVLNEKHPVNYITEVTKLSVCSQCAVYTLYYLHASSVVCLATYRQEYLPIVPHYLRFYCILAKNVILAKCMDVGKHVCAHILSQVCCWR